MEQGNTESTKVNKLREMIRSFPAATAAAEGPPCCAKMAREARPLCMIISKSVASSITGRAGPRYFRCRPAWRLGGGEGGGGEGGEGEEREGESGDRRGWGGEGGERAGRTWRREGRLVVTVVGRRAAPSIAD